MDNASKPGSVANAVPPGQSFDLTGKTLGDFHVLRRLGQGGMGQVYLAEQLSLKRKVALKIMRADLAANPTALKRFKAEAEAVARITHANIVQVYFIGEADGLHYMALEYVDGRNLREYLAKKGPPEPLLALSIMRQVAAALQRASELGIVHRDIKPENILLTRKAEVKVADFGLSRIFAGDQQPLNLTQSGVTMGTPLYMSPEQVQGQEIDPRTDIYSLGITSYHMLSGEPPFKGQTALEVAMKHVQGDPVPLNDIRPDLPAELVAVVHKMMAKEPANRYQNGRELLKDLTRLRENWNGGATDSLQSLERMGTPIGNLLALGSGSQSAVRPSAVLSSPAPPRRRWVLPVLSVLLALLAGAALGFYQRRAHETSLPEGELSGARGGSETPDQKQERLLREKVKPDFDPKDAAQVKEALDHHVQLGLFYLRKRWLNEADAYFSGLAKSHSRGVFHTFGQLGLAIVYSFRDEPQKSNDCFLNVVKPRWLEREKPGEGHLLRNYGELWELVDESLDRNSRNNSGQLPPLLERFRWAPGRRSSFFEGPGRAMKPAVQPEKPKAEGNDKPAEKKGS